MASVALNRDQTLPGSGLGPRRPKPGSDTAGAWVAAATVILDSVAYESVQDTQSCAQVPPTRARQSPPPKTVPTAQNSSRGAKNSFQNSKKVPSTKNSAPSPKNSAQLQRPLRAPDNSRAPKTVTPTRKKVSKAPKTVSQTQKKYPSPKSSVSQPKKLLQCLSLRSRFRQCLSPGWGDADPGSVWFRFRTTKTSVALKRAPTVSGVGLEEKHCFLR